MRICLYPFMPMQQRESRLMASRLISWGHLIMNALWKTAARENGELVKSVKDNQVQQILASLITTTKINDSSRLAGRVQQNLYKSSKKKYRGSKNLGIKEGPFYVLHGADMPSILVEVGFLTHRKRSQNAFAAKISIPVSVFHCRGHSLNTFRIKVLPFKRECHPPLLLL